MDNVSKFPKTSPTSGPSKPRPPRLVHDQELAVAQEIAQAIYRGRAAYAAQRLRLMQDPAIVALEAVGMLGILMSSPSQALKTMVRVLESHR